MLTEDDLTKELAMFYHWKDSQPKYWDALLQKVTYKELHNEAWLAGYNYKLKQDQFIGDDEWEVTKI